MKQVLLTLGLLLVVLLGYYWISVRYAPQKEVVRVINDKEIYFETPEKMTVGTESEIKLMARHESGKLVNFSIDFTYEPGVFEILNVEINKDIFDKVAKAEVDEKLGKVIMVGQNSKNRNSLVSGDTILATIKIKASKKGGTMIYSSKRPEVGILDGGKVYEGNFQMPNFKVNFL
jgi:hypothetical protein